MKRLLLHIAAALLFVAPTASAQTISLESVFQKGNDYYKSELFEEALNAYMSVLGSEYENGELYYNIANTYYKLGNKGKTVLYYEKAKLLLPEDDDLNVNLGIINVELADRITPLPDVFYVKYWKAFANIISLVWWKNIFLFFWWAIAICLSLMFFTKQKVIRKLLKANLVLFAGAVVISSSVLFITPFVNGTSDSAIVMPEEVRVFASPSETGTEVFTIHEGTKVSIKRSMDGWIEIRLADGKVGWIRTNTIEII